MTKKRNFKVGTLVRLDFSHNNLIGRVRFPMMTRDNKNCVNIGPNDIGIVCAKYVKLYGGQYQLVLIDDQLFDIWTPLLIPANETYKTY